MFLLFYWQIEGVVDATVPTPAVFDVVIGSPGAISKCPPQCRQQGVFPGVTMARSRYAPAQLLNGNHPG